MLRQVSLEEISDGRLYEPEDMVRAGCGDCAGCSFCCQGMGNSIVLDPLDFFRLEKGLGKLPQDLLSMVELQVVDGIILPNLRMEGEDERCLFLNEEGRCQVHAFRPGICRMFPLGRYYEGDSFRYFLQVRECKKSNRTKVKVKKWLDTPEFERYESFVADWHRILRKLQCEAMKDLEGKGKKISLQVLKLFYLKPYDQNGDFYLEFGQRVEEAKRWMESNGCGPLASSNKKFTE